MNTDSTRYFLYKLNIGRDTLYYATCPCTPAGREAHSVLILDEVARRLEVLADHLPHQRVEVDLALPPEQLLRLCGVAEEQAGRIQAISDVAPTI